MIKQQIKCSFSLIEIAVVLAVAGSLMVVSLNGFAYVSSWLQRQNDLTKMQTIKIALESFFKVYGRLPAPAKYIDIATNENSFGTENNISVYNNYSEKNGSLFYSNAIYNSHYLLDIPRYGIVPFKSIGLQKEDVIDAYGNFIEYYAVGNLIDDINEDTKHGESNYFTKRGYVLVSSQSYNQDNSVIDNYVCGAVADGTRPCNEKIASGEQLYSIVYDIDGLEEPIKVRPYGLRVKNIQTDDFVDRNGTIAFVLVAHGKNGCKTCGLKHSVGTNSVSYISKINVSSINQNEKYEAQNCLNVSSGNGVMGREMVKNTSFGSHSPFIFYQGVKTSFFDDIVEYSTLAELLLKK